MSANQSIEELYTTIPVHIGNAVALPEKWGSIYDWMAEKEPEAFSFAHAWKVDSDTLQDYYSPDLEADGYFTVSSESDCDCCGKNIIPGTRMFSLTYPDGSTQEPLCLDCARDCMDQEAIAVAGTKGVLTAAHVATDVLELPYWLILAWIVEHKVSYDSFTDMFVTTPAELKVWITGNIQPGGVV